MNIVFMGTPEFSVPSLKALIDEFGVKAVFTQPDKPKGRGKKLTMSPVKEVALEHDIPVYQPYKLRKEKETIEKLKSMNLDFIIVVAYGQILPKEVIDIPKYGCINLHASLLPKYRGAAPINWAIIKGETKSGNTTMLMDEGLDTGDMLLKQEIEITESMTAGDLHDNLMESGSLLLIETIKKIVNKDITRVKQEETDTCYASMLDKKMGNIDWNLSSFEINNLIKGLNPWPVAYTYYKDKAMKVYKAKVLNEDDKAIPGTIISVSKEGIKVSCGKGCLLIQEIQFPSKKVLKVEQYIIGNSLDEGLVLKDKKC